MHFTEYSPQFLAQRTLRAREETPLAFTKGRRKMCQKIDDIGIRANDSRTARDRVVRTFQRDANVSRSSLGRLDRGHCTRDGANKIRISGRYTARFSYVAAAVLTFERNGK